MTERDRQGSDGAIIMDKTIEPRPLLERFVGRLTDDDKSTR